MAEGGGIPIEVAAGARAPEARRTPETRDTREAVLTAFNQAFEDFTNAPEASLTPEQLAAREYMQTARESFDPDNNRFYNTVRFRGEDGRRFSQREFMRVDELITWLRERIESSELTDEQAETYREREGILHNNAKDYYRTRTRRQPAKKIARIHHEARRITADPRLTTGNEHDDFLKASETLFAVRELIVPPAREPVEPPVTEPPVVVEPPTEPPVVVEPPVEPPIVTPPGGEDIFDFDPPADTPRTPGDNDIVDFDPPQDGQNPPDQDDGQGRQPPPGEGDQDEDEDQELPGPAPIEAVRREVAFVNRTLDMQRRSREMANTQLQAEMKRGSAFNPLNWPRKMSLRIAEEYFRQKMTQRAYRAMLQQNNAYLSIDLIKNRVIDANNLRAEEQEAGLAKAAQVQSGETLQGQRVEAVAQNSALQRLMINDIIRPAVEAAQAGTPLDRAVVQRRLTEFVRSHLNDRDASVRDQIRNVFGGNANEYGRVAEYFATDLLEVAGNIAEDISAHRYSIDQLDTNVDIKLANARWAAETQAQFNVADRIVRFAESRKLTGVLINPATIGAAVSIAGFLNTKAAGWAGGGLLAGAAFAAFRRNYDLKIDMAAHRTERAYGEPTPANAPRREALERFAYDTASVNDLLNGGRTVDRITGMSRRSVAELRAANLADAGVQGELLSRLAEIKMRLDLSALDKKDLITFESRGQVEQGRLALVRAMVEIKDSLRGAGLTEAQFSRYENAWRRALTANVDEQDRKFGGYRLRNAAGTALFAVAFGGSIGLLTQEAMALKFRSDGLHVGTTVLERGVNAVGSAIGHPEWGASGPPVLTSSISNEGFNRAGIQELFKNPGNKEFTLPGGQKLVLAVSPDISPSGGRGAGFLIPDAQNPGQFIKVDTPPMQIMNDGRLVTFGDKGVLPTTLQNLIDNPNSGWKINNVGTSEADRWFNVQEDLKQYLGAPDKHATFLHGNLIIDVNPNPNEPGMMSMTDYRTGDMFVAEAKLVNNQVQIDIDPTKYGNPSDPQAYEDLQKELSRDAWKINTETQPAVDHTVNVKEYLTEKGEMHPTHRELWHNNETPMRQVNGRWVGADGKELQFHHRIVPSGPNKGMIELDFSKMESQLRGGKWANWDYTVDNQYNRLVNDIVAQPDGSRAYKNFEIMVTPNEAANQARQAFVFNSESHPELGQGKLWLNPGSEEAKMFFQLDENGRPQINEYNNFQRAKFIEVAHTQPDGSRTILSTSQGAGVDQFRLQTPSRELLHLTPPGAIEITPPPGASIDPRPTLDDSLSTPIIPLPASPRHPIEGQNERPGRRFPNPFRGLFRNPFRREAPVAPAPANRPGGNGPAQPPAPVHAEAPAHAEEVHAEAPAHEEAPAHAEAPAREEARAEAPARVERAAAAPTRDLLAGIEGDPAPRADALYVETPPPTINALGPEERNRLGEIVRRAPNTAPFFVVQEGQVVSNPDETAGYVPWRRFEGNNRFNNAEERTDNDSGLLALAATLAENPRRQAQLYRALSEAVLDAHRTRPELIAEWLRGQNQPIPNAAQAGLPAGATPLNRFDVFDKERDAEDNVVLRPAEERLIHDAAGNLIPNNPEALRALWAPRITELQQALQNDNLEPRHYRWIEFLSHSINIPEVLGVMRAYSERTAATRAPAPRPAPALVPAPVVNRAATAIGLETAREANEYQNSSPVEIPTDERERYLDRVDIHGDNFRGRALNAEVLRQSGLTPAYSLNLGGGATMMASVPYQISGGRIAVVGYMPQGDRYVARTFYFSNSQMLWRYLPGYRTKNDRIDWYSKGFGEESVMLPISAQIALAQIATQNTPRVTPNYELVFAGTARNRTLGNTYVLEVAQTPVRLEGNFYPTDPNAKIPPEQVTFANDGQKPNFTNRLATWRQKNPVYGDVTVDVYRSVDGNFTYMFCKDSRGRGWIAGIEDNSSAVQPIGLRQNWIRAGDLTTPAYEYAIPEADYTGGYGNNDLRNGNYADMYQNYLSHVPVIREYIEATTPRPMPHNVAPTVAAIASLNAATTALNTANTVAMTTGAMPV